MIDKNDNIAPREKILQQGVAQLRDFELIAVVLGSGSRGNDVFNIAKEVSLLLSRLGKAPKIEDLLCVSGVGVVKACQILACLELSQRFLLSTSAKIVTKPEDLVPSLAFMKGLRQESMVVVCFNGSNQILGIHRLTMGLANQTQIHNREAFAAAIQDRALGVIFAHNHPSGSLKPSLQDLECTKNLVQCGEIIGIPVLDHIIISPRGWSSIKESYPHIF
ncbi:MAG: DNA repair protein RadC [Fibrobacter sp.]|nr:DNA repair protein RadC [Fibrobacter sp.]